MFKAIILDLDGTLAYTIDDLRSGMNGMLEEMGYPLRSVEDILSAINYGSREFVRRCLPDGAADDAELFEKCFERYNHHYAKHYLDSTHPYDKMPETLDTLKKRGYKLAVLSNKGHEHTVNLVKKIFPEGLFDIVLGNSGKFPTKPEPDSGLYIASQLGVSPREVLYVGDSNIDMKTAKNAGFFACGVTWGYRSADVLISSGATVLISKPEELLVIA